MMDDATLRALDAVACALPGRSMRRTTHLAALVRALLAASTPWSVEATASGGAPTPALGPNSETKLTADLTRALPAALRLNLGLTGAPEDTEPPNTEMGDRAESHAEADDGEDAGEDERSATPPTPPPAPDAPAFDADRAEAPSSEGPDEAADERSEAGDDPMGDPDRSPEAQPAEPPSPEAVAAALLAVLPPGLLDGGSGAGGTEGGEGRRASGVSVGARGRPAGTRRRPTHAGQRPAILATLRAAVPWQRARGRAAGDPVAIRPSDLRYERRVRPAGTTVVFAVDASGSAARERLSEAKGAVEALLAEAYVRRDKVALVAFRGGRADLLLPPTRGLVTARRALGAVPGGGATPLAAGLLCAAEACRTARAGGERALMVVLTDGRGNVALDGTTGRLASRADEERAAFAIRHAGHEALVIDTAARPGRHAPLLAKRMGATLLAMPRAGGEEWAAAVSGHLAP